MTDSQSNTVPLDEPVDSGMSADAVERAEWAWANLPTGPRKWTSLTTAEKALACHTITALTSMEGEREKIVAWLLNAPAGQFGEDNENIEALAAYMGNGWATEFADAISRGDHMGDDAAAPVIPSGPIPAPGFQSE